MSGHNMRVQRFSVTFSDDTWRGTATLRTDGAVEYRFDGGPATWLASRGSWSAWEWSDGAWEVDGLPVLEGSVRLLPGEREGSSPQGMEALYGSPEVLCGEAAAEDRWIRAQQFLADLRRAQALDEKDDLSFDFTEPDLGPRTSKGWKDVARNMRRRYRKTGMIDATRVCR